MIDLGNGEKLTAESLAIMTVFFILLLGFLYYGVEK